MDVSVLEHTTSAPVVVTASAGTMNIAHTQFAQFVNAWIDLDELAHLAQVNRTRSPAPVILAQFTREDFCNERLAVLYQSGIQGYVIGKPTAELIDSICAPIFGYVIRDTAHGQLRLYDQRLSLKGKRSELTPKLTMLCRELLEARGSTVSQDYLYNVYYGTDLKLKTHSLETQIWRLRKSFKRLGLPDAIPGKSQGGYRLVLD